MGFLQNPFCRVSVTRPNVSLNIRDCRKGIIPVLKIQDSDIKLLWIKMDARTTPGCSLGKTADECRECSDYRICPDRVHVICGKSLCPNALRENIKARCVGCQLTMTCPDRDPSIPRVFPKMRKKSYFGFYVKTCQNEKK